MADLSHDSAPPEDPRWRDASDDGPDLRPGARVTDPADRQRIDNELVQLWRRDDFDTNSPVWITLAAVLIEYGYGVILCWLRTGTIYQMAANVGSYGVRGLPRIPRGLVLRGEDAHDVTTLVVELALRRFPTTVRTVWNPAGNAQLTSFFVGRCLMELPDAYERWQRQRDRWLREWPEDDDAHEWAGADDPERAALAAVQLQDTLAGITAPDTRAMVELHAGGYSAADIAEMFTRAGHPHTEHQVRSKIYRANLQARARRERDERGAPDAR